MPDTIVNDTPNETIEQSLDGLGQRIDILLVERAELLEALKRLVGMYGPSSDYSYAAQDAWLQAETAIAHAGERLPVQNARVNAASDLLASVRDFVALYDNVTDLVSPAVKEKVERARAALAKAGGR